MQCAYHPEREPVGACVACGRLICVECKALLGGKIYCTPCADKIFVNKVQDQPVKETIKATVPAEASVSITAAPASTTAREVRPPAIEHSQQTVASDASVIKTTDSGKGSLSSLPVELKGWNWGAFFLNWIWGIGNKVWISFIVLVLGLIWCIVLGLKGNEWAWQSRQWDNVEHFRRTQKTWKKWGIVLFVVSMIFTLIVVIASVALSAGGYRIKLG